MLRRDIAAWRSKMVPLDTNPFLPATSLPPRVPEHSQSSVTADRRHQTPVKWNRTTGRWDLDVIFTPRLLKGYMPLKRRALERCRWDDAFETSADGTICRWDDHRLDDNRLTSILTNSCHQWSCSASPLVRFCAEQLLIHEHECSLAYELQS